MPPSALDVTDALIRRYFPAVRHLQVAELQQLLGAGSATQLILLDAREPAEYAVSRIPGAANVSPSAHADPDAVRALLPAEGASDTVVVFYCSIGFRSSQLASALMTHRPEWIGSVYNLEGSIFRWANAGYALVSGPEEAAVAAQVVHPYSNLFGRMLEANLRCGL